MIIETQATHTTKVAVIRLPFHRVPREPFLVVIQSQHILKDINLNGFPGQVTLYRAPCAFESYSPSSIYRELLADLPMFALFQSSSQPYVSARRTLPQYSSDRVVPS